MLAYRLDRQAAAEVPIRPRVTRFPLEEANDALIALKSGRIDGSGWPMVTLGVELASQPKRTATCRIRWDGSSAVVESLSLGATDADLLRAFQHAGKIGIDAPFGWPAHFVRAIHAYSSTTVWPSVDVAGLRFRRTDWVVKETLGRWPLSVASDLIAVTAIRTARLLAEAAAAGESIDRCGNGRFVETYPAAALGVWGFPSRGYKGTKGAEVRTKLVADLVDRTHPWLVLTDEDRDLAKEEGWIALPQQESLGRLV